MTDWSPLWISFKIAAVSTVISFIIGVPLARAVMSLKRFRYFVDSILSLPLVLPPTVVGFFLLLLFGNNSEFGKFLESIGIRVVFTWYGAVIASVIVTFPIIYRSVRGAFEAVDMELIDVARLLGCGRIRVLLKVWLPLSWPVIASGVTLSFARALGEFGATIMVAGNLPGRTRTMSVMVYTAMQSGNRELAFRWTGVIIVISLIILVLMNLWTGLLYRKD